MIMIACSHFIISTIATGRFAKIKNFQGLFSSRNLGIRTADLLDIFSKMTTGAKFSVVLYDEFCKSHVHVLGDDSKF